MNIFSKLKTYKPNEPVLPKVKTEKQKQGEKEIRAKWYKIHKMMEKFK